MAPAPGAVLNKVRLAVDDLRRFGRLTLERVGGGRKWAVPRMLGDADGDQDVQSMPAMPEN